MSAEPGRARPGHPSPMLRGLDGDDVTRYLCAGAYLDQRFAWDVVGETLLDRGRGVAPAPGADVEAVVRHSLAAVRRAAVRDVLLTLIVLAVAVLAGFQGILIAVWILSWALVARSIRSLAAGETGSAFAQLGGFLLISMGCLFVLLLRADSAQLGAAGVSLVLPLRSAQVLGLIIAALWLVNYLDRTARYGVLAEQLSRGRFVAAAAPVASPRWHERLGYIDAVAGSPLTVYSPDARTAPFVGFGPVVHTWSVSSHLGSPASAAGEGASPPTLSGARVYADLLGAGPAAGFSSGEIVLAPGWLPPGHPFLDAAADRPAAHLLDAVVREIAAHPGQAESYYLVWSAPAPAAGPVATAFVQASVRDGQFAVEVALTVLPPVAAEYRAADRFGRAGGGTVVRMLGAALIDVGRRTPQAPVNLARSAWRLWSRRPSSATSTAAGSTGGPLPDRSRPGRSHTGRSQAGAGADHGARAGVRELAAWRTGQDSSATDYEATRQVNQLSRELTGAISRSLSAHGYDPTGFLRGADSVWQKPLASGLYRGAQVQLS